MSKKILSLTLALILALVMSAPAFAWTSADWAKPEIEKAQSYGLIPDVLKDADLTKPITRAEFAAVAVKAYENFTGTTVSPVASNPFTDTSSADVLKAFNINIVNGTSATTYNPNGQLTRQDAATMLTRVEKKAYISGWTLSTDNTYTLNFTQPAKFADDNGIADYAKASVYFMNAKGIINGTGNNNFSPTVTATRQEALIIAARMVEKLKGVALDYSGGTTEPPSGNNSSGMPQGNTGIVGVWLGTRSPDFSFEYITFYEDGTFRFQLHRNGLYGFNRTQDKTDNQGRNIWGTYSFSGNTGTWKYDAASASSNITLESDGGLDLGSSYNKFYRCNSIDNYKLNGSYTSYSNPSDPDLTKQGKKPVIHFKSDGTFTDDGLFSMVTYLKGIGETDDYCAPGSGTFELKDFTLILRYSDGRVRQTSFTFSIKSTDASSYVLVCNGFTLNKMP